MTALAAALALVALAGWARPRLARRTPGGPGRSRGARHAPRRAPRTTAQQWAALLDAVAAEVRTGSSTAVALQQATAAAPWCRHAAQPDQDEEVVLHVVHAARTVGGAVAPTLDAAAALLRERIAIRAEAAVHSAQARLSARVLTVVPLGFCTFSLLTSASFRAAWCSRVGFICAVAGGLCNLAGWIWMRHIVTGVQR